MFVTLCCIFYHFCIFLFYVTFCSFSVAFNFFYVLAFNEMNGQTLTGAIRPLNIKYAEDQYKKKELGRLQNQLERISLPTQPVPVPTPRIVRTSGQIAQQQQQVLQQHQIIQQHQQQQLQLQQQQQQQIMSIPIPVSTPAPLQQPQLFGANI
jgi:hypothetical protein